MTVQDKIVIVVVIGILLISIYSLVFFMHSFSAWTL